MNASFGLTVNFNSYSFLSELYSLFQKSNTKKVKAVEIENDEALFQTYSIETTELLLTALNRMISDAILKYETFNVQQAQAELDEIFSSGMTLEFVNQAIAELNQSNKDIHYQYLNILGQSIELLMKTREATYTLLEIIHRDEINKFLALQIQSQKSKGGKLTFDTPEESLKYLFGEDLKNEPKR
jgi:hypothetical protein